MVCRHRVYRVVVDGVDVNGDGIVVALRSAASGIALVGSLNLHTARTVEIGGWGKAHTSEGAVDIGQIAGEYHGSIGAAVTGAKGQSAGAAEGRRAIGAGKGNLHAAACRIDVGYAYQIVVVAAESWFWFSFKTVLLRAIFLRVFLIIITSAS